METLIVPASMDNLTSIRNYVKEAASAAGVSDEKLYQLQLAADEIATNIITYGYSGKGGEISVRGEIEDDALTITLEDSGPAFDPRERELPSEEDLSKPLEERAIGGLGIFLAVQGVDRFDYRREGGKNVNALTVFRHSAS
ncbi:MAG: ATP-binding protein [Trueperaceae bacterium]|nr:MAG: ATP-binding protein [Trueperaceae bacterium]